MNDIDWDSLTFSLTKTDWMYIAKCKLGDAWTPGKILPYGSFEIDPAAGVLNYGQGIFEGMKAYHTKKDRIVLFRPDMNAKRMSESTEKMCIPKMVPDYFVNAQTLSPLEHVKMQSAAQKWIDSSISKTINCP